MLTNISSPSGSSPELFTIRFLIFYLRDSFVSERKKEIKDDNKKVETRKTLYK
jgi:hypothetical protein